MESVVYSLASFIIATSLVAWLRRRRLPDQDRLRIELHLRAPRWGERIHSRILSLLLALSVIAALGMLGYALATPKDGERFSEFYLLGRGGRAGDYPNTARVGEEVAITVGIVNRTRDEASYRVEIRIDGQMIGEVGPVVLADGDSDLCAGDGGRPAEGRVRSL